MKGCRPLKTDEIEKLRSCFKGRMATRNRALFFVGINTGFRISELLSLTLGDVLDVEGQMVDRLRVAKRHMKGKKSTRSVVFNEHAKRALLPWLKVLATKGHTHVSDFVFVSSASSQAISRIHAWRILRDAFRRAHLTDASGTHVMRKTFANFFYLFQLDLVASGVPGDPFRTTSKALGHSDIKSTDQYLSFITEDIDNAVHAIGI